MLSRHFSHELLLTAQQTLLALMKKESCENFDA